MRDLLQLTDLRGSPQRCGELYGERFDTLMMGFCKQELRPDPRRIAYARRCWAHVQRSAPVSAQFMRGLARGSKLSFDHIVLLTLHEEIYHQPHCTAFAATGPATRGGRTIVAQNWDWAPNLYPWPGLLRLSMTGLPRTVTYHYPGLWACAGVNEAGLSLMWTGGGYLPKVKPLVGVPTYVLISEIMQRTSVPEALAFLAECKLAGCFLFFLGDADGRIAVAEGAAGRMEVATSDSLLLRANHYTCPSIVACSKQQKRFPVSRFTTQSRYTQMKQLAARHHGRIDEGAARAMLTHRGKNWPFIHVFPGGRDAIPMGGMTIDSLFAVSQDRVLHTCRGGRAAGKWQSVEV